MIDICVYDDKVLFHILPSLFSKRLIFFSELCGKKPFSKFWIFSCANLLYAIKHTLWRKKFPTIYDMPGPPEPTQSHQGSNEGGPELMAILLDISRRLKATEAYITSQQETEMAHRTGAATQPTRVKGRRRSNYLRTTSPARDTTTNVTEAVY